MAPTVPTTYEDIDWAELRRQAQSKKGWRNKGPQDWDAKASSFASRNKSSAYIDLFLDLLPLDPTMTILDVGSGPGTLSLPLADRVASVTALDFSSGMLAVLNDLARERGITNISTVHCAWEGDWQAKGIQPHDIAIASRAMGVEDLEPALRKINDYATQYVFLSDRIGATPFDVAAFAAVGRPFAGGPDYIYTVNMLYTLGIHANVTVLTLERELTYPSMDEAFRSYSWMFNELDDEESEALRKYLESRIIRRDGDSLTLVREDPPRWAVIWWRKQ